MGRIETSNQAQWNLLNVSLLSSNPNCILDLLTEVTPPTEKDTHATHGKILKYKIKEILPLNAQLYCNNCNLHLHVLAI